MRYAIISDIHANEAALRVVLQDAADAHVEKIVCLGDVLGYGPDPVATLELVYRRVHVCLAGNHDLAVAGKYPVDDFTDIASAAVKRHRAALSKDALAWLAKLPQTCEFSGEDGGGAGAFACAHGDFASEDGFGYVLEGEDAAASFEARSEQLLFVGHTHRPSICVVGASGVSHMLQPADFVLEDGKRYMVNVGSVGYPRCGICRSFYCIYDDLSRTVFFRSLPFDIEAYTRKMQGRGFDEAPWMRIQKREMQVTDIREAAHFGKEGSAPRLALRRVQEQPAAAASQPQPLVRPQKREASSNVGKIVVLAVLGLVGLVMLAAVATRMSASESSRPTRAAPSSSAPVSAVEAEEDGEELPPQSSVPAVRRLAGVVASARCAIAPGDRRVAFKVALQAGSAPVWVRVGFVNATGASMMAEDKWIPDVKKSRRSPKKGVPVPLGATGAVLELFRVNEQDRCRAAELSISPLR